jgi:rhodanese-related sulfurtransferase
MSRRQFFGPVKITGVVLSFALLISALFQTHEAHASASAPTMDDVRAEAVRGGYRLIDFGELRDRLEREPGRILLVDTRQDWEHRTGHIPDSINFSFEPTVWSRLKNRWALKEALGADTSRPLVFY